MNATRQHWRQTPDRLDERDAGDGPLFDDLDVLAGRLDAEVIGQQAEPGDCSIRPPDALQGAAARRHLGHGPLSAQRLGGQPPRAAAAGAGENGVPSVPWTSIRRKVGFDPSPAPGTTCSTPLFPAIPTPGVPTVKPARTIAAH
ncbi:MAG: hypothetical protein R3D03_13460 [Geminicoccaceae bacterium]